MWTSFLWISSSLASFPPAPTPFLNRVWKEAPKAVQTLPVGSRPALFERQGDCYSNSSDKCTPKPLCPILLHWEHIAHFVCKSLLSLRICPCKDKRCVFNLPQGNHFSEIKLSNMKDLLMILWLHHNHFFSFTLWPLRLLLWLLTLPSSFLNASPRYLTSALPSTFSAQKCFLSRNLFCFHIFRAHLPAHGTWMLVSNPVAFLGPLPYAQPTAENLLQAVLLLRLTKSTSLVFPKSPDLSVFMVKRPFFLFTKFETCHFWLCSLFLPLWYSSLPLFL